MDHPVVVTTASGCVLISSPSRASSCGYALHHVARGQMPRAQRRATVLQWWDRATTQYTAIGQLKLQAPVMMTGVSLTWSS